MIKFTKNCNPENKNNSNLADTIKSPENKLWNTAKLNAKTITRIQYVIGIATILMSPIYLLWSIFGLYFLTTDQDLLVKGSALFWLVAPPALLFCIYSKRLFIPSALAILVLVGMVGWSTGKAIYHNIGAGERWKATVKSYKEENASPVAAKKIPKTDNSPSSGK